jgi:hypothetical protein
MKLVVLVCNKFVRSWLLLSLLLNCMASADVGVRILRSFKRRNPYIWNKQ